MPFRGFPPPNFSLLGAGPVRARCFTSSPRWRRRSLWALRGPSAGTDRSERDVRLGGARARVGRRGRPRRAFPPWSCAPRQSLVRAKGSALLVVRSLFAVGLTRGIGPRRPALRFSLPPPVARLATVRPSSPGVPPSFEVFPRTLRRIASRLRPLSWGFRPYSARDFGSPLPPGLPHPVRSAFRASHPPGGLLLPKRAGLFHPAGALGVLPFRVFPSQGDASPLRRRLALVAFLPCVSACHGQAVTGAPDLRV